MFRSALVITLVFTAFILGGATLMIGAVAVVKLTAFLVLSVAVASTLIAISPRFQG